MSKTTKADQLLKKYHAKPPLHQRILQLKALLFHVKNKSDFNNCIRYSTLRTEDNKKIYDYYLNPILEQLVKDNLLTADYNCHPDILHSLTEIAINPDNPYTKDHLDIIEENDFLLGYEHNTSSDLHGLRALHLTVHMNHVEPFLEKNFFSFNEFFHCICDFFSVFYLYPLDMSWVKTRHPIIQAFLCCTKLTGFSSNLNQFPPDILNWVQFHQESSLFDKVDEPFLKSQLLQIDFCMGLLDRIRAFCTLETKKLFYIEEVQAGLAFFEGDFTTALQHYEMAIKLFKPSMSKQEWLEKSLHGILYILALSCQKEETTKNREKVAKTIAILKKNQTHNALPDVLEAFFSLKCGDFLKAQDALDRVRNSLHSSKTVMPFLLSIIDWVSYLSEPEKLTTFAEEYKSNFLQYQTIHHRLSAHLYAELIAENESSAHSHFLENSPFGSFRFLDLLKVKQAWEHTIEQLQQIIIGKPSEITSQKPQDRRLAWLVNPDNLDINVLEQKIGKSGTWTAGKAVALKRLHELHPSLDYLSDHDKKSIAGLAKESIGWYDREHFYWESRKTLLALIGHPLVFHMRNPSIHLELVKGELTLQIENTETGYHLLLEPCAHSAGIFLEPETTHRYRVIDFPEEAVAISRLLSKTGLTVPKSAKDKVIDIIRRAKPGICIHSDVEDGEVFAIEGDTTIHVHLLPLRDGLKMNAWIRPFGAQGPYYKPAEGKNTIIAVVDTQEGEMKQKAIRNFDKEEKSIQSFIQNCPILSHPSLQIETANEWYLETIEMSLEALAQLNEYKKEAGIIIEWPKGEMFKLKKTISPKNLSLSIQGSEYWFEYEGEVRIDPENVLNIKNLLDLLDHSHGRFIQLKDGEFIALTEHFKKQLEELKTISDGNKIHHLSLGGLKTLSEEAESIRVDSSWKTHLKKLKSMEKHQPVIPSTLQANLREYQAEGFAYLSKLANWGIGACLADDMGLGKTIQAIALLLEQAPRGPSLVVAPTSVCLTWFEELKKFAPTLSAYHLNVNDRESLIHSLDKMDVLVCSYPLLHQSGETLIAKNWQVVILDEAQAIKNPDTKRWKYATQLKGKSRIALTGTPIENHLGELWSIFKFLNPGLLGSMQFFQSRYSLPIEKSRDPIAKRALKNLVYPYILRRTKSEVLVELPPKTEQSIIIEPTDEETAFYEAIRLKALGRIQQLNDGKDQTKRFEILSEINKLRQACCHSSLVDENIEIENSKLKTFINIVRNLIENHHKALVFSQYVRYLNKVRTILNHENISYQYLDGATPIKERQKAIDAFQAGESDLFLISLKAGGAGLNLTAADYVIILDPWWNPAVEDQASARAHRMGQERPVTVYRLIMKNSIEEKILKLHKDKRDLADDLLSGSDISGKITEEELIRLITE